MQLQRKLLSYERKLEKLKESKERSIKHLKQRILKKDQKLKRSSMKSLRNSLWKITSKIVRHTEKYCFTCLPKDKKLLPWKLRIAGHFFDKHEFPGMKWEMLNVHTQCEKCNRRRHSFGARYSCQLIRKYGYEAILKLEDLALYRKSIKFKYSREELENHIQDRSEMLKKIEDGQTV